MQINIPFRSWSRDQDKFWATIIIDNRDVTVTSLLSMLLSADQHTVWHHDHIIMLINVFLITKDACCHCRSVYGIPNAKIPEVTLSFVIASFPSCSQRSCTGYQKVSRGFHQWLQASLVPRQCPAQFSWPHNYVTFEPPHFSGQCKGHFCSQENGAGSEQGYGYARVAVRAVGSRAPRIQCFL